MKFLFEITTFSYSSPVFYRICQINSNEYEAQPVDQNRKAFRLRKHNGFWIGEGNYTQNQADQIGKQIDKMSAPSGWNVGSSRMSEHSGC